MSKILMPIEWAVFWIMVQFHKVLSFVMDPNSGWTWILSIVGLTVLVRILILPLFAKQIRASRAMQIAGPELRAVQQKYKGKTDPESRQAMTQETMEVYRKHGASPVSSCLPLLIQMPIFFGLFRALFYTLPEHSPGGKSYGETFGGMTPELAKSASTSTIFSNTTIADSFLSGTIETKLITGIIIALMCAVTFLTQKELTMKNLPPSALEGPAANMQKIMLYVLPFIYIITGPGMPLGVLIYWLTTNVWSFGQQWWMIRNNPTPGSDAEKVRHERINEKRAKKGLEPLDFRPAKVEKPVEEQQIRVQPKRYEKGRRLSDEEMLERARRQRAEAQAKRRAQNPGGSSAAGRKGSGKKKSSAKKRNRR
ncbi:MULTISPECIES: membrane protein insertase YidC [Helcobacillus]|uniref:Membrane protein insertase YidC n=1 Tax=Helcobacillus massiliensis TaxID=521392 RepID=A0A839QWJ3_9MICO|nr:MULTISPECIES: membrane protein insertase YidC [Helcobacillus]MBB3024065.1 YidC/Oxa1 family membrane protein insertase [Helcobacillus massiliensis]MCG7427451.1 membrane protein insertase YidC [Helcobacillus sp. ACRRO]